MPRDFDFYCVPAHGSNSLSTQTENLDFPVNQDHVTEYCAVICTHSTVCGAKLLYGHVPDPFPRCGHTNIYQHLTYMVVQVPGTSAGNNQCTTGLICPYPSLTSNAITLHLVLVYLALVAIVGEKLG